MLYHQFMSLKDWVLLLIPTTISLASFFIALITFQRDKPQLRVSADYSVALNEMPTISVIVNNIGKRPTTIVEAGFRPDYILNIEVSEDDGAGKTPLAAIADLKISPEPVLIDPGVAKRFTLKLNQWPSPFIHADTRLLPYAKDVSGNYYYGGKEILSRPILRHILDSKGKAPSVPSNLTNPDKYRPKPLTPKDLYPRQKLMRIKIAVKDFFKAQFN